MSHQASAGRPAPGSIDHRPADGPEREIPGRWAEALQHPLTLLFLFLSGLAVIHLLGISPFPVGQLWGAFLLLAAAVGAAGSLYWAYALRHAPALPQPASREGGMAEAPGPGDLEQLRSALEDEFADLGWDEGLKSLAELRQEHEQLQGVLAAEESPARRSSGYISHMAEETYRQGLKVLGQALELTRTVQAGNRDKLEAEIAELEGQIRELRRDQAPPERITYREETIGLHRQHIALLDQQQMKVEELLYQAELCESSLARAHIDLAARHATDAEIGVGAVTEALQNTIDRARQVQEELQKLGL